MSKSASFKTALSFPNRSIDFFNSKIRQQGELLKTVRCALPDTLAHHVRHCLISGHKLLLYTDSAAWATQLRFYTQTVLAAITHLTKDAITSMQIKLLLEQSGPSLSHHGMANLPSPERLAAIRRSCSFNSALDNELTVALLRLTKTLEGMTRDK